MDYGNIQTVSCGGETPKWERCMGKGLKTKRMEFIYEQAGPGQIRNGIPIDFDHACLFRRDTDLAQDW